MQRALNETEDGRKAKEKLKKDFDQKQKELDEQQTQLKKDIEDLDKKRTLLPADKVREKESELRSRLEKVQQTYVRHQQDLQGKEQKETAKIFERMTKIISEIAAAENFSDRGQVRAGVREAPPGADQRADSPLQLPEGWRRRCRAAPPNRK
jgi:outer membrane protein